MQIWDLTHSCNVISILDKTYSKYLFYYKSYSVFKMSVLFLWTTWLYIIHTYNNLLLALTDTAYLCKEYALYKEAKNRQTYILYLYNYYQLNEKQVSNSHCGLKDNWVQNSVHFFFTYYPHLRIVSCFMQQSERER